MLNKLEVLEDKYKELSEKIADPEIINDQKVWQKFIKEHAEVEPIVMKFREYKDVMNAIADSKTILQEESDEELRELAKMELSEMEEKVEPIEEELKILLLPKDPNDDKNVIVEIRGGAGGDEAALFAGDLFRMYCRYAERRKWKIELLSASDTGVGGYKEVSFMIKGNGAYSVLKYESGVHRVQRIPSTESGGRIHTSTATVAVLPEVEDVEVEINPNDLRIDVFRSSGNGGQSVNTTDSAVRVTHIPTGEVVSCQDGKSQLKNKEQALKILKARLYDKAVAAQHKDIAAERKSQVGTGDRSERIRTYNFPQGRVSDHRINLTLYKLDAFLDGDLNEMIDALITVDQTEKMMSI
ncbi:MULTISPECIES: peptide chain release factor 1 [Paraclostridium]|uniref:Peptide chain release factor 1 n=1 Tax=Paraclostridium bifermentans TaxID=1490 RepID=A0A1X2JEF4_PARBF|nr:MULTISPECIES: peptide chain release factor 1 [Paraclostridium]KGJ48361.1 peptide chain release factor 1 [Clostridium sp. NCR]MCU9807561.1 peptide chain release factor 1 [Paraclostridium sp. AKS46]MDV8115558.1 peptide chain release factor 1 [Bacillus sp. BAU-SS-2023]EQK44595.1 peptide chain release factor 1 [[Clostridium] bifermentans ATCC 19299] [Paraclostridium bifermentans ATCC 19299]MBN8049276.1 peptide chain release factor 1 [Paraclostridium bifermentans]